MASQIHVYSAFAVCVAVAFFDAAPFFADAAVGVAAAAKLVHAPLSVQSPTEPPGVEPYDHHFAVQRWPL